jgi:translation initiation factor IF-2
VLVRALFAAALLLASAPAVFASSGPIATGAGPAPSAERRPHAPAPSLDRSARPASCLAYREGQEWNRDAPVRMSADRDGAGPGSRADLRACSRMRRGRTLTRGLEHARRRARGRSPVARRGRGRRRARSRGGSPPEAEGRGPGSGAGARCYLGPHALDPGATTADSGGPRHPRPESLRHARLRLRRRRSGVTARTRRAAFARLRSRFPGERELARRVPPAARRPGRAHSPAAGPRRGRGGRGRRRPRRGSRAGRGRRKAARRVTLPLSSALPSHRDHQRLAQASAACGASRRRLRGCAAVLDSSAAHGASSVAPISSSHA